MKLIFAISIVALSFFGTACRRSVGEMILVPMPQEATFTGGYFETDSARFVERAGDGYVACRIDPSAPEIRPEGYRLKVTRRGIDLTALDSAGLFYGRQTLCLLATAQGIPCVEIIDNPCFGYRGIHLDVSRHFFPVETIFRLLDEMARYKLNKFHFHLADNGGWRIRIDAYPLLTRLGAFRTESDWLEWWSYGDRHYVPEDTPGAYGGYYTKEEIRRIVAYAAERFIEVIPEIEFPGHSDEVFAAYPELCCSGRAYTSGEFCVGNPLSLKFMDEVLTEVLELFPSKYIHIGGDECPKVRWEKCPRCQARIRQLGLRDKDGYTAEHYLQGYVTDRIGKYLAERGRRIIGWDEILEGQAPSDAIVMSWRGSAGGIKAAKLGHDVIMTPNSHFYFDYYQSPDADAEPFGIGGCVTIDKVYSFDPMADLTPGQQAHILGVQANLWTEYIASDDHLEYMLLPRLAALSEVQWCQPGVKDWVRFRDGFRMDRIYSQMGYAFAKHIFGIKGSYAVDPQKGAVVMTLTTQGDAPIHYTLDGSEPTAASPRYTGPVEIGKSARFRATALREGGENASYSREFAFSKSTGRPAVLNTKPNDSYTFEGASLLVDGYHSRPVFTSGAWLGYLDEPLDVTIDMGGEQSYSSVELETLAEKGDWIFPPSSVTVWVSDNGTDFTEVASVSVPEAKAGDADGIGRYRMQFPETSARYLKVVAQNAAAIPAWHPGAGSKGFLFVDEVVVE